MLKEGEEEALFSKELATIRIDVPIRFELPKGEWKKGVNFEDINELLRNFGFRSLVDRTKQIFAVPFVALAEERNKNLESVDRKEIEEIGIALWLVNSSITNPTLDDILN